MDHRRAILFFGVGTASIAAIVVCLIFLIRRCPCIAPAIGGGILLVGGSLLAVRRLTILFAPEYLAERFLNRFRKQGGAVWFASYDDSGEDSGPDTMFSASLEQYESLRLLKFRSSSEECLKLENDAGLTAAFLNGCHTLNLTGTLRRTDAGDGCCAFEFRVKPGRFSDWPKEFPVKGRGESG